MSTDNNLKFIQRKVKQLGSAIMYSMSDDLIRFPNSIVNAIKVDDEGQLWFLCAKPPHLLDQCSQTFPVRLHFYRKGECFHVQVSGKAVIVNDPSYERSPEAPLLVKMNMMNVEYTEAAEVKKSRVELWLERFAEWINRHIAVHQEPKSVFSQLRGMTSRN